MSSQKKMIENKFHPYEEKSFTISETKPNCGITNFSFKIDTTGKQGRTNITVERTINVGNLAAFLEMAD